MVSEEPLKELDYWEHNHTEEIVCPYCGFEYYDPWEFDGWNLEIECDGCERTFRLEIYTQVTYSTERLDTE